jgi:hypothetical protein
MQLINKRKIVLLLVAVVVLCATGIAVAAFYSTTIESLASVEVVTTDQALLALEPGNDPAGNMVETKDGVLLFTFSFNEDTEQCYQFTELFYVRNNSADDIEFTVESEGISYIFVKPSGSGDYFVEGGVNKGYFHLLASGQSVAVEVSFNVPAHTGEVNMEGSLKVKSLSID